MGLPGGMVSGIGSLIGEGQVSSPNPKGVAKDYLGLLKGYQSGVGGLYDSASKFAPKYAGLTMDMLQKFLPGLVTLLQSGDPAGSALLDKLTSSASSGLDMGRSFDRRSFDNDIMSKSGTRGMGYGPADAIREAVARGGQGENLLAQRQSMAGTVAGEGFTQKLQPLIQMLTSIVGGAQNNLLTPANSLNLMTVPYAGKLAANTATAANRTSLVQSADANTTSNTNQGIQMLGSIMCWVAREVYGPRTVPVRSSTGLEEVPKWILFRGWLMNRAPRWFFRLYMEHGAKFAAWLHNKPRLKTIIRRWMDARIATLTKRTGMSAPQRAPERGHSCPPVNHQPTLN